MMEKTIGVDAGGSLVKIAYEEGGKHHFKKYPIEEIDNILGWLKMISADRRIVFTGGKSVSIKAQFPEAESIDEFNAACEGAKFLISKEKLDSGNKFLLVNIGTGTSWFKVEDGKYERVLGSGVGGGSYMGLGMILTGSGSFSHLVELSSIGDRGSVDLLVSDIYAPGEPPIPGDLTASNFAKAAFRKESSSADKMASAMNMISETITLLTVQAAVHHSTKKVVYIGSTVSGNEPLKASLKTYAAMSGLEVLFLANGEFSGALGASLS